MSSPPPTSHPPPSVPISIAPPPALTLQLPFLLLGTRNVPAQLYNHAERRERPLHALQFLLSQHVPAVKTCVWVPGVYLGTLHSDSNANENSPPWPEKETEKEQEKERHRREWEEAEKARWAAVVRQHGWVIRLGHHEGAAEMETRRLGWVGAWREGDGVLSAREKAILRKGGGGKDVWSVPVVLQRFGVPVARRGEVMEELGTVLRVVGSVCWSDGRVAVGEKGEGEEGAGRYRYPGEKDEYVGLRVLCTTRCQVKIAVAPQIRPESRDATLGEGWDIDMVARTLLCLAAFERELLLVEDFNSVLHFFSTSRFLTHWFVGRLRRESRELLGDKGGRLAGGYDVQRERWERGLQVEDIGDLVDEPELWGMVDEVWRLGREEGVWDLVREMERCEGGVGRLAVGFPMVRREEEMEFGDAEDGDRDEDDTHAGKNSTTKANTNPLSPPYSTASKPEPATPQPFPGVSSILFQSHTSSISGPDIAAYTDLVTQLIVFASTHSYAHIRLRVQSFRKTAKDLEEPPLRSFTRLMALLGVQTGTGRYYRELLEKNFHESGVVMETKEDDDSAVQERDATLVQTPFDALLKMITKKHTCNVEYMPTFFERYSSAGGFHAVSRKKLHALLVAEEEKRTQKRKTGNRLFGRGGPLLGTEVERRGKIPREMDPRLRLGFEVGVEGLVAVPGMAAFEGRVVE